MTYADQAAAIGAAADNQIAALNAQLKQAQDAATLATQQVAQLQQQLTAETTEYTAAVAVADQAQADLAVAQAALAAANAAETAEDGTPPPPPPPPPPPVAKTLYGVAPKDFSQASVTAIMSAVAPASMRTYDNPVPSTWAGTNDAHLVPSGVVIFESGKSPIDSLALGDPTQVADVKAILRGLPGGAYCDQHEPENPSKNINPVMYRADWAALFGLIAAENATRAAGHTIVGVPTYMAYSLSAGAGRDIAGTWLPANCTDVGFDIYRESEMALAIAFAKARGLNLWVPEYGFEVGSTAPTDDQYVARINQDAPQFDAAGVKAVLLFDVGGNSLDALPKTTAAWRALCTRK